MGKRRYNCLSDMDDFIYWYGVAQSEGWTMAQLCEECGMRPHEVKSRVAKLAKRHVKLGALSGQGGAVDVDELRSAYLDD